MRRGRRLHPAVLDAPVGTWAVGDGPSAPRSRRGHSPRVGPDGPGGRAAAPRYRRWASSSVRAAISMSHADRARSACVRSTRANSRSVEAGKGRSTMPRRPPARESTIHSVGTASCPGRDRRHTAGIAQQHTLACDLTPARRPVGRLPATPRAMLSPPWGWPPPRVGFWHARHHAARARTRHNPAPAQRRGQDRGVAEDRRAALASPSRGAWPGRRAHPGHGGQAMRTRRVIWPLLSQYVVLPARSGSSAAGCTSPFTAIARDVTVCSPDVGVPQS